MPSNYGTLVSTLKSRLPDDRLDALGRTVAFIRRLREVRASLFVWALVMSRFGQSRPGFEQARQWFERFGGSSIWRRPFQVRCKSASAVKLFERVFEHAVAPWRNGEQRRGVRHPLASRVADVVIVDSTTVQLSAALRSRFKGTGHKGTALLKVVLSMSAFKSVPLHARLTSGAEHDHKLFPDLALFARGTLFLFDKGFFSGARLLDISMAGHHFLCSMRASCNPRIVAIRRAPRRVRAAFNANHDLRLRDVLARRARINSTWDLDVLVAGSRVPARLVLVPGRNSQHRGFYTSLKDWPPRAVAEGYRVRWQIELVFKELKQYLNLESMPTSDPHAVQVFAWASLLALVISRCISAWLWSTSRIGLAAELRPTLLSRALAAAVWCLPWLLTAPVRRAAALAEQLRSGLLQTASQPRRHDTFGELAELLPA
jgi:hypothetical protein